MNALMQRIEASFRAQGLMQTLGATLDRVTDGEVRIVLAFSGRLSQQHGYLHAGAVTSIVDSACGYAAMTRCPVDYEVVTAEFKTNFVRPAIGDQFLAIGRVQSAGRLLTVCTGEVFATVTGEPDQKLVALTQATIVNVARPQNEPHSS